MRIYWPGTQAVPAVEIGTSLEVSAHRDFEGDLVFDRVEIPEGELLLDEFSPRASSPEEREAVWRLLDAVAVRGARKNGIQAVATALAPLPKFDWQRENDALRAAELIKTFTASPRFQPGDGLLRSLAETETAAAFPEAQAAFCEALVIVPPPFLKPYFDAALRMAADAVRGDLSKDRCEALATSIRMASGPLDEETTRAAARPIAIDVEDEHDSVARYVLGPANPAIAAEKLGVVLRARLERFSKASDDDESERGQASSAALKTLDAFEAVAEFAPRQIRTAVRRLPFPQFPAYAERLLALREKIDALDLALPAAFLRTAATASRRGASLARRHGLKRRALRSHELRAILDGVVKFPVWRPGDIAEVRELMKRRRRVEPVLSQLAYVAREGGSGLAARFYDGDLLEALFESAEQEAGRSPPLASQLLSGAVQWRSKSRRARQQAARGFGRLLNQVQSEESLNIVLTALLEFFAEHHLEQVLLLRRSLLAAMKRVGKASSPKTRELVTSVASLLGVEEQRVFQVTAATFLAEPEPS